MAGQPLLPRIEPKEPSPAEVERRLLRGYLTARFMPDIDARFDLAGRRIAWARDVIDSAEDRAAQSENRDLEAVRPHFQPTRRDLAEVDEAMGWFVRLAPPEQRLVVMSAFGLSMREIARRIGRCEATARRHYREAIHHGWQIAHRDLVERLEAARDRLQGRRDPRHRLLAARPVAAGRDARS